MMSAMRCSRRSRAASSDMTRYHDVVARLSGEEFAVVTPNMDAELPSKFAERIRKAIANVGSVRRPPQDHHQRRSGRLGPQGNGGGVHRRADRQLYERRGKAATAFSLKSHQDLEAGRLMRLSTSGAHGLKVRPGRFRSHQPTQPDEFPDGIYLRPTLYEASNCRQ